MTVLKNLSVEFARKNAKLCPIHELELFIQYLKHFHDIRFDKR